MFTVGNLFNEARVFRQFHIALRICLQLLLKKNPFNFWYTIHVTTKFSINLHLGCKVNTLQIETFAYKPDARGGSPYRNHMKLFD